MLQMKIEPDFVLFFDCSKEEMTRHLLNRNQVGWLHHFFLWIINSNVSIDLYVALSISHTFF